MASDERHALRSWSRATTPAARPITEATDRSISPGDDHERHHHDDDDLLDRQLEEVHEVVDAEVVRRLRDVEHDRAGEDDRAAASPTDCAAGGAARFTAMVATLPFARAPAASAWLRPVPAAGMIVAA